MTAYLKNGGTLERAALMANHASSRTTQLYDHRRDEVTLDEVERVMICRVDMKTRQTHCNYRLVDTISAEPVPAR